MKIVFLDVDGVLNGYNPWSCFWIRVWQKLKLPTKLYREIFDVFAIKERYVRRLAKIVHSTNAVVVMSSSWRVGYWKVPYENLYDDQKKLYDLLSKYNINIVDITPTDEYLEKREDEIQWWLDHTNIEVENFVILDDESSDLQKFVGNHLVKTSKVKEGDIIKGLPYEDTGLKWKHVKQAIKILNGGL